MAIGLSNLVPIKTITVARGEERVEVIPVSSRNKGVRRATHKHSLRKLVRDLLAGSLKHVRAEREDLSPQERDLFRKEAVVVVDQLAAAERKDVKKLRPGRRARRLLGQCDAQARQCKVTPEPESSVKVSTLATQATSAPITG